RRSPRTPRRWRGSRRSWTPPTRAGRNSTADAVRASVPGLGQGAAEYLFGGGAVILDRTGPLPPNARVDSVAIGAQVPATALVFVGQHLPGQWLQAAHVSGGHPQALGDTLAIGVVDQEEVPQHALLDVALALGQEGSHVVDQVLAFPLDHGHEAGTRLLVVVAPFDDAPGEPAADLRCVVRTRVGGLVQAAVDGGLVVHVRVLARCKVDAVGHLAAALVGVHPFHSFGLVDRQLQVVGADPV